MSTNVKVYMYLSHNIIITQNHSFGVRKSKIWPSFTYRLLYGRGVPLGHIGTGVVISARGPIWLPSANMT